MKKFLYSEAFLYLILFGTCMFVLLQSPLAPFAKGTIGVDSSVFIYSAQQILDGQLMYKDIVDHKGPFLYFINAVALFLFGGNFIGIWIFEVLSLFAASIMMYKTARFFADKFSSLLAVITSILFLVRTLAGGNLVSEWVLPYISIALYIFVGYLKENKPLDMIRLFILSLTFVLAFMLRANLVAMWAGFGIVLLIKWIAEKRYNELIHNLSFILLFVLISLLPFFLYFYCKGTLSDAIYLTFTFNMFEYAPANVSVLTASFKILAGQTFLSIISVITVVYMFFRDKTIVNGGVLSAFILTTVACSLGGRLFGHYFMFFVPLIVITYAYLLTIIKESLPKTKYFCLFIMLIFYNCSPIGTQAIRIVNNYYEKKTDILTMEKLAETITQNTKSTDKILVNGFRTCVYLYSHRICATRFPYPLVWSSLAKEHYVKDAENALPKLIIQGDIVNSRNNFNLEVLLNNKYQLIETDIENVEIWKLKE